MKIPYLFVMRLGISLILSKFLILTYYQISDSKDVNPEALHGSPNLRNQDKKNMFLTEEPNKLLLNNFKAIIHVCEELSHLDHKVFLNGFLDFLYTF